jgi:hypothetical protein
MGIFPEVAGSLPWWEKLFVHNTSEITSEITHRERMRE